MSLSNVDELERRGYAGVMRCCGGSPLFTAHPQPEAGGVIPAARRPLAWTNPPKYKARMTDQALTIQSVIERLQRTNKPARTIDFSIGELIGWIKNVEMKIHPTTKEMVRRLSWVNPEGARSGEPPDYTSDIQVALDLANLIAPKHVGAVTWDSGICFAQMDDSPKVRGATPPIAVCIAALKRLQHDTGRE